MRGWMQRNLYDIIDWNGGYVNFFGEFCIDMRRQVCYPMDKEEEKMDRTNNISGSI
ncbi:MAG: hypothetical protein J6M56_11880 [Clostridia bacterium]|nr:hypothetical protein [Clostridia bacterium]